MVYLAYMLLLYTIEKFITETIAIYRIFSFRSLSGYFI